MNHAYFRLTDRDDLIPECNRPIALCVDELLQARFAEMLLDAHGVASTTPDLFHSDEDIRVTASPCVGEGQDVLQKLALLLVSCTLEGVLVALKIK